MSEFQISKERPTARVEQETVITYDRELDTWSLYTTVPPHARKWEDAVIPSDVYLSKKIYHKETGDLIAISGEINGSGGVHRKRILTEEQRAATAARLKVAREAQES